MADRRKQRGKASEFEFKKVTKKGFEFSCKKTCKIHIKSIYLLMHVLWFYKPAPIIAISFTSYTQNQYFFLYKKIKTCPLPFWANVILCCLTATSKGHGPCEGLWIKKECVNKIAYKFRMFLHRYSCWSKMSQYSRKHKVNDHVSLYNRPIWDDFNDTVDHG